MIDRLWTDLEASKKLVDNINTLFQPIAVEDKGEEGVTGGKSSVTIATQSNKPHAPSSEADTSATLSSKTDPASLPLDNVKVEQRLSTS